jgi:hypothetical protein
MLTDILDCAKGDESIADRLNNWIKSLATALKSEGFLDICFYFETHVRKEEANKTPSLLRSIGMMNVMNIFLLCQAETNYEKLFPVLKSRKEYLVEGKISYTFFFSSLPFKFTFRSRSGLQLGRAIGLCIAISGRCSER